jgi:hypothetical protein
MSEISRSHIVAPELFYASHERTVAEGLRKADSALTSYHKAWEEIPEYPGEIEKDTVEVAGRTLNRVRDNMNKWTDLRDLAQQGLNAETAKRGTLALSDEYDELASREAAAFSGDMNPLKEEIVEDLRIVKGLDAHVLATAFTEHVFTDEEIAVVEKNQGYVQKAGAMRETLGNAEGPNDAALKTLLADTYVNDGIKGITEKVYEPLDAATKSLARVQKMLFPHKIGRDDELRTKEKEIALITLLGEKKPKA